MSFLKLRSNEGFTLMELMVTIVLIGILSVFTYSAFNTSIAEYFHLQKQSMLFTDMAIQSQRIANVVRSSTDIIQADPEEMTIYAYFSPADTYVSKVHYYKNADKTKLFADVTRMTANPPIGTEVAGSTTTYRVLDNYSQSNSVNLFTYLDASGNALSTPIADLTTIKGVRVSLVSPTDQKNITQSVNLQVSLRNRKTNL